MKIIHFFRSVDWPAAGRATKLFLMCLGSIALCAWLPNQPAGLAIFGGLWLSALWYGLYFFERMYVRVVPKTVVPEPKRNFGVEPPPSPAKIETVNTMIDAVSALENLGYEHKQAKRAVRLALDSGINAPDLDAVVRSALAMMLPSVNRRAASVN